MHLMIVQPVHFTHTHITSSTCAF